jgi:hypothetical protein
MKTRYEHRPGLFGLGSIAAGCAAKDRETQTRGFLTAPARENYKHSESQSEPATTEKIDLSNSSGPLQETCRSGVTYQSRKCLKH